jgi:hypothetical protein
MHRMRSRRLSGAFLAVALGLASLPAPALAAQPDYQVQPQGVQSGEAVFRIINLGADNGGSSTARIERLDKAGVAPKDYPIPKLKINEFADIRYALNDPCPTIKLKVTADARNDVKESSETNNVWQGGLTCPAGSAGPGPAGGLTSVDVEAGAERLGSRCPGFVRPAECTIELEPSDLITIMVEKDLDSGAVRYELWRALDLGQSVGYTADDEYADKSTHWQTAVTFDLAQIAQYRKKFINQAVLEYIEILADLHNEDQYGNTDGYRTCANRVGKVTDNWPSGSALRALDYELIEALHLRNLVREGEVYPGASGWHAWWTRHHHEVNSAVQRWLGFPAENHGLVLVADNETFPRNQERCLGFVTDLKLTVTFTVLE